MGNITNQIHCIDNLLLLPQIPSNSINLIYNDVLFGTARKFKDFQDLELDYKAIENHYLPRFNEMKRVLADNGTIYIHADEKISHWLRIILDDIFGIDNFRNEIIWAYNSAPRKKGCLGKRHDKILRYTKTDNFTFNAIREPYSSTAPRGYDKEKYYHKEGKVIGDVWTIPILGQNDKTERVGYSTQKPKKLIERIVKLSSNAGDIVADFYAGSGTTLVCAKELKRNYIGCDINPNAVHISETRLKAIQLKENLVL